MPPIVGHARRFRTRDGKSQQWQAALAAHLTGHLDEAIRHYRKTLELDPRTATAHSNLAVILDEAGQDRETAVHYRQAIALLGEKNAAYRERMRQALARLESTPNPNQG